MIALLALVQQVAEPFRAFIPEDTLFRVVERRFASAPTTAVLQIYCD